MTMWLSERWLLKPNRTGDAEPAPEPHSLLCTLVVLEMEYLHTGFFFVFNYSKVKSFFLIIQCLLKIDIHRIRKDAIKYNILPFFLP